MSPSPGIMSLLSRRRFRVREFGARGLEDESKSENLQVMVSSASPSPGVSSRKKDGNGTKFSNHLEKK